MMKQNLAIGYSNLNIIYMNRYIGQYIFIVKHNNKEAP